MTATAGRSPSDPELPGSSELDNLDRDRLLARRSAKWHRVSPDVLPAWVADMDFPVPPPVRAALHELVDSADLGYPDWPAGTPLRVAFAERMRQRYGWQAEPDASARSPT